MQGNFNFNPLCTALLQSGSLIVIFLPWHIMLILSASHFLLKTFRYPKMDSFMVSVSVLERFSSIFQG